MTEKRADLTAELRLLAERLATREREQLQLPGFRAAAVLVPLLLRSDGLALLFTERSGQLAHHAGQIAFPGGRVDPGETITEAARRETLEEIGLTVPEQAVIGLLDDHPSPAQYIVTPVVAVIDWPQPLTLNRHEVADAFTVPLARLRSLTPRWEERELRGLRRRLHYYDVDERTIWGLTGNVVKGLLDVWRG